MVGGNDEERFQENCEGNLWLGWVKKLVLLQEMVLLSVCFHFPFCKEHLHLFLSFSHFTFSGLSVTEELASCCKELPPFRGGSLLGLRWATAHPKNVKLL